MSDVFRPNVTVAAIVYRDGQFLLVREHTRDGIRINQPAGHLERGESLIHAAVREAREETGYAFTPSGWLGSYLVRQRAPDPAHEVSYLRFAFVGAVTEQGRLAERDPDILESVWMDIDTLRACVPEHRSPLVLRCAEDYLAWRTAGRAFLPLDALYTDPGVSE